jgi:uncharacterized protein
MQQIFADTFYWVALLNPRDAWHQSTVELTKTFDRIDIITTDEILTEVLNFLCNYGLTTRSSTAQLVRNMIPDPHIQVR